MSDFDINLNMRLGQFDNSINSFNNSLNNSINNVNENINNSNSFEEVFNSIGQKQQLNPISGSVETFIDTTNKVDNVSQTAKMASDIGKGFSNGLTNLNAINKASEDAFETFASGGDISVHEVMIASQKSSLAMQMAIQLRNQMINAYNEFKNMSI